jgi:hypothetical protein
MSRGLSAIGLLASCCVAAGAYADDFSWDLAGAVSQGQAGDLQDTDGSALSASYHFAPVDDSRGPYELAAFLDPVSLISASVSDEKVTFHPTYLFATPPEFALSDATSKHDDYTVDGRYVLPESKWYAGGGYTKSNADSYFDVNTYRVLAGKYLGQRTSLELTMDRSRLAFSGTSTDVVTENVGLGFVHVRNHESFTYSLFGGVTQTNAHERLEGQEGTSFEDTLPRYWTYSLGAELFPTTKLGFRVGYSWVDRGGPSNGTYDVAATWFVKRKIGIQLGWSQTQYDSGVTPRNDTANLRFVGRF